MISQRGTRHRRWIRWIIGDADEITVREAAVIDDFSCPLSASHTGARRRHSAVRTIARHACERRPRADYLAFQPYKRMTPLFNWLDRYSTVAGSSSG